VDSVGRRRLGTHDNVAPIVPTVSSRPPLIGLVRCQSYPWPPGGRSRALPSEL